MEAKLSVSYKDLRRFVEWSCFIEEGDIHARRGTSSIDPTECELSNRLALVWKKLHKHPLGEKTYYKLSFVDCETLQYWYHKLPAALLDQADADLHAAISIFIHNTGRQT